MEALNRSENSFAIPRRESPSLDEFLRHLVKSNSSERASLLNRHLDDSPRLRQGRASDVRNAKGQTHLHLAAAAKHRQADLLRAQHVQYTQDVNVADCRGNTPLHLLLSSNYYAQRDDLTNLVRIILQHGANVEVKNDEGKTPLHAAVALGSQETVKLLLEHRANPRSCDNRGFGALHYLAASPKNAAVCANLLRSLLNAGCDLNARSQHGRTPLYVAVCTEHNVCFDLLVEHGANVEYRDVKFDTTILHIAAKHAKNYVIERLMRILNTKDPCEKDAMINAKQKDGRTALHLASRHKVTSILSLLLRNGADVECLDSYGRSPLHYACQYSNAEAFDVLMDFGADISARDCSGMTPMKLNEEVEALIWLRVVTRNAKSMAVGLPVVDFRKNLIQIMHKMKSYEKYNVEVEQMKRAMINSTVSVYDLLLNEEKMYQYRNNVVLKEIVMFGKLFPSFREMIVGKYRRAGMRRYLVRLASKTMWRMTGYRLESALSDMIFGHLSNTELHTFIEAASSRDDQD